MKTKTIKTEGGTYIVSDRMPNAGERVLCIARKSVNFGFTERVNITVLEAGALDHKNWWVIESRGYGKMSDLARKIIAQRAPKIKLAKKPDFKKQFDSLVKTGNKIIIHISGGNVTKVLTRGNKNIQVIIIDEDLIDIGGSPIGDMPNIISIGEGEFSGYYCDETPREMEIRDALKRLHL